VNNHVVEAAGAANFTTAYDDQTYLLLSSDRRTDAILLDALIEDNPQSDLIPKLVNGLLAHRTKGRWEIHRRMSLSCWHWTVISIHSSPKHLIL
jgi:hypothetical protein